MERSSSRVSTKRKRRVAVACDQCRQRRIRCDGSQPVCSFCATRGHACAYYRGPQRVRVSKDYVESLAKEIQDLKDTNSQLASRQLGQLDSRLEQNAVSTTSPCGTASSIGRTRHTTLHSTSFLTPRSTVELQTHATATTADDDASSDDERSVSDTIVCAGSHLSAPGGKYFGPSSTPAFLQIVQKVASCEGIDRRPETRPGLGPGNRGESIREAPAATSTITPVRSGKLHFLLPPRWSADRLIETYFSKVFLWFTILHESTFREEYEQLWQPMASQPGKSWVSVANSVFALGALFSDHLPTEESESMAETFFAQAMEHSDLDSTDEATLTTVQALLLMGHYLHIKRVARCWHVFSVAIRAAQALGMHLTSINNKYGVVEREVRKRCWCGCLVMDAMVAMTFGRPTMIPTKYYDSPGLPEPVDDARNATILASGLRDDEAISPKISLFLHRVRLCIIIHNILQQLYEEDGYEGREANNNFRAREVAKFDQELRAWLTRLPTPLRLKESDANVADLSLRGHISSHMLYSRYLMVRILLTRPSLVMVANAANPSPSNGETSSLDFRFTISTAEACVDASERLIDHIRVDPGFKGDVAGAAWHNTNCIFNAALVVFLSYIVPALQTHVPDRNYWQDCVDVMRWLSRSNRSARACLSILDLLNNRLLQLGGRPERQIEGLHGLRQDETDFGGLPLSMAATDWVEPFGVDELLLGTDFSILQDMSQNLEL